MGVSRNDPKIVYAELRVDGFYLILKPASQVVYFFVSGNNRIIMHDKIQILVFKKVSFNVVDHVMAFDNVVLGGHFHMDAGEFSSGAIIVYHKVMGSENAVIA